MRPIVGFSKNLIIGLTVNCSIRLFVGWLVYFKHTSHSTAKPDDGITSSFSLGLQFKWTTQK